MNDFKLVTIDPALHGPGLHAVLGDEESCRYLGAPAFKSVDETIAKLVEWGQDGPDTQKAIIDTQTGDILGRVTIFPTEREIWEAGVMIAPNARGRALAVRSLQSLIDETFENLGARRIVADVDADNLASIKTFEKLGFILEGRLRGNWHTHIGERDSLIFGLMHYDPRPWRQS